ncbi:unnamed protein product [Urochloa decumbens]|uniref:Protein kinase domain-containing protein n=1 Tax=Urochloa decumbens TaxID=240449 RepID=A0ABC8VKZ2_9POAL
MRAFMVSATRLQLVLAAAVAALASSSQLLLLAAAVGQIGLPLCRTVCGDVSVPYPFGITPECSLPGFNLTCDTSSTPARLSLGGDGTLQVTDISLDNATVRVHGPAIDIGIPRTIFPDGGNGTWGGQAWGLSDGGTYILSAADNEFIISGCNLFVELLVTGEDWVTSSCGTVCGSGTGTSPNPDRPVRTSRRGCNKCSGIGCCQTPITKAATSYDVRLVFLNNKAMRLAPPFPSSFSILIAEEGWFDRNSGFNLTAVPAAERSTAVPAVLAWAIRSSVLQGPNKTLDGNATCPSDIVDSTACHSRYSSCTSIHPSDNTVRGYTCKCWDGYQGNPYLPDGCQDINECEFSDKCYGICENVPGNFTCKCQQGTSGDPRRKNGCLPLSSQASHAVLCFIIGLGIGSGTGLLFLVFGGTFLLRTVKVRRNKRQRQIFFKQNRGQLLQKLLCQRADIAERMIITLEELEKATNNFDKARKLGVGGHGTVYKGILSSLHVVAIKKSKIMIQREIDEFINEVAILSQVNHRNIVKLHGCCLETQVPLLVYEFISNGTLYDHLHVKALISLSWRVRLRIAVEIARALTYLHSFVSMPIIHRDIKSPNILLDDNFIVKLSDFGASRYIPVDLSGLDTVVQGTLGYLDPMYHSTGHLTEKSDVYSFGVLLIELLTRKKPVSYRSAHGYSLPTHFVTLISEGKLFDILDPQVTKEGDGEVVDVALLAAICVKMNGEDRPTMRKVEMALEGIHASKEYVSSSGTDDESENWIQINDATVGETAIEDACWDE